MLISPPRSCGGDELQIGLFIYIYFYFTLIYIYVYIYVCIYVYISFGEFSTYKACLKQYGKKILADINLDSNFLEQFELYGKKKSNNKN